MDYNNHYYHGTKEGKLIHETIKEAIAEFLEEKRLNMNGDVQKQAKARNLPRPPQRQSPQQVRSNVEKDLTKWAEVTESIHNITKKHQRQPIGAKVPLAEIPMIQGAGDGVKIDPDTYYGDELDGFTIWELSAIKKANNKHDTSTRAGQEAAFAEYPASVKKKVASRKRKKSASYPQNAPILENEQGDLLLEKYIKVTNEEARVLERICKAYNVSNEQGQLEAFMAYPDSLRRKITAIGTGKTYRSGEEQRYQETTYIFRK